MTRKRIVRERLDRQESARLTTDMIEQLSNYSEQRFVTAADILKIMPDEGVSKCTIDCPIREGTDFDNYWAAKRPWEKILDLSA
jgi:hypothetical protein